MSPVTLPQARGRRAATPRSSTSPKTSCCATPTAEQLCETVRSRYAFLVDLDPDDRILARADERDRPLALTLLTQLPGNRLSGIGLY